MTTKNTYWKYMVQIKAWQYYLENYTERSYSWDKGINVFTAVVSSTSIAGWAIWNQISYVWGILIAVMQVVTAIKSYLPFGQRLQVLPGLQSDLTSLYNDIEYKWYQVSAGIATDEDINQMLYEFRNRLAGIENTHLKDMVLPERSDIKKQADERAEAYFAAYFPPENRKENGMPQRGKAELSPLPLSSKLPQTNADPKCPV